MKRKPKKLIKRPDWLFAGAKLTIQSASIQVYIDYLIRQYNEDNEKPVSVFDKDLESKLVEYLEGNPSRSEVLWVALGYAIGKHNTTMLGETPNFSLFKDWLKSKLWDRAVKNKWLLNPNSQKEFEEYIGIR